MSEETIDNLKKFINDHTAAEYLQLTWYGGEPLMTFKTIKKIMERITTETTPKLLYHRIVTNSYFFDSRVCDFFKLYPLNDIQITLDGEISGKK